MKYLPKIVVFLSALAGLIWSSIQIHQYTMGKRTQDVHSDNIQAKMQGYDKAIRKPLNLAENKSPKAEKVAVPTDRTPKAPEEIKNDLLGGTCTYSLQNKTEYDLIIKILSDANNARLVYIPSGKEYTLKNLPEGKFKIKYTYGIGWDASKKTLTKTIASMIEKSPLELKSQDLRVLRDGDIIRTKVCEGGMVFSTLDPEDKNATTAGAAIPSSGQSR